MLFCISFVAYFWSLPKKFPKRSIFYNLFIWKHFGCFKHIFENTTKFLCYILCYFLKSPELGISPGIWEQGTALVYSVQCTVYSVQCTVYSVQCTVYSVQCTVYSVQCNTSRWSPGLRSPHQHRRSPGRYHQQLDNASNRQMSAIVRCQQLSDVSNYQLSLTVGCHLLSDVSNCWMPATVRCQKLTDFGN